MLFVVLFIAVGIAGYNYLPVEKIGCRLGADDCMGIIGGITFFASAFASMIAFLVLLAVIVLLGAFFKQDKNNSGQ